jgi:phage protein D/phage baseplate assembly protein gpV
VSLFDLGSSRETQQGQAPHQRVPALAVELDGGRLSDAATASIVGLQVRQRCNVPTACEVVASPSAGPPPNFRLGATLRVALAGYPLPLFDGEITAIRHVYGPTADHQIRVRAYDRLHRLRKHRAVKAWEDTRVSDVAREVGAAADLTAAGEKGPDIALAIQDGESDLDFLVALATDAGMRVAVQDGELWLFDNSGTGTEIGLQLGRDLREVHVDVSLEPALQTVRATSWDLADAELRSEEVAGTSGPPRVGMEVDVGVAGSDGVGFLIDAPSRSSAGLQAQGRARLDRAALQAAQVWGVSDGNPALRPGVTVVIGGVDADVAGSFVVTSVDHVIDDEIGFSSEFSNAPPPLSGHDRTTSRMTIGRVVDTRDPDSKGRVRVAFSAYQDQRSGWLPVLSPGTGEGKGFWFLPDQGDLVLVLAPSGDLANACVAGTLPGSSGPLDAGTDGSGVARTWWGTRGGTRLQLADRCDIAVDIEDSAGNRVSLGAAGISVHAAGDLTLEAPGHTLTLRASAIEHQKA